jgi:hypothetical protein
MTGVERNLDKANNQLYFGIHDYGSNGARKDNAYGGPHGPDPLTDLSADWHRYGLYWRDDNSGPYGSMQFYLDGKPLWSPYTLSSAATNMASGIYIFLLLDNDKKGCDASNAFLVQYVRVWRLRSPLRYMTKQKLFCRGDDFTIKNDAGEDLFFLDGEALPW